MLLVRIERTDLIQHRIQDHCLTIAILGKRIKEKQTPVRLVSRDKSINQASKRSTGTHIGMIDAGHAIHTIPLIPDLF